MTSGIRDNIARVHERIRDACRRAGRRPEEVRLVAASKTVPPDRIREAYEAGLTDFGENRVQEAKSKSSALADLPITWHLIGHLQTNKARAAREIFQWVHSVDSERLAEKLASAESSEPGQTLQPGRPVPLKVLIEVNLGGEESKSGVSEDGALELASAIARIARPDSLELRGLMLVPPYFEEAERARPFFSRLRELAKLINSVRLPEISIGELSMGMSHDFEVAIEEGATLVRVGTAIFGSRTPK